LQNPTTDNRAKVSAKPFDLIFWGIITGLAGYLRLFDLHSNVLLWVSNFFAISGILAVFWGYVLLCRLKITKSYRRRMFFRVAMVFFSVLTAIDGTFGGQFSAYMAESSKTLTTTVLMVVCMADFFSVFLFCRCMMELSLADNKQTAYESWKKTGRKIINYVLISIVVLFSLFFVLLAFPILGIGKWFFWFLIFATCCWFVFGGLSAFVYFMMSLRRSANIPLEIRNTIANFS